MATIRSPQLPSSMDPTAQRTLREVDTTFGNVVFVDPTSGNDENSGDGWDNAYATFQAAVTAASAGDTILLAPGTYDENVTIPRTKTNLVIIGKGGRGAVAVEALTNGDALTIHADDVTLRNVGLAGDGTGNALVNYGSRTRMYESKLEGGTRGLKLTLGTAAQVAAHTHGKGADLWFIDCEIAYNTTGVMLVCTDYGAVTQVRFRDCAFHDNTKDFDETVGSGGSAAVMFRDLDLKACDFHGMLDGQIGFVEPTAYIDLNGSNSNNGVVSDCSFPTALAGGKNLVSTGLKWVANKHTGGISNGQPS